MRQQTLEEYLAEKYPNYEEYITCEELKELKDYYDNLMNALRAADYCLAMQFDSKAGVDYVNDYDKNMAKSTRNQRLFHDKMTKIRLLHVLDAESEKEKSEDEFHM